MYINENTLNKIVSDTLRSYLTEAPTMQNQNTMQNGNTMQNQNTMQGNTQNKTQQLQDIEDVRKNKPGTAGQQAWQTAGKAVAGGAGLGIGMGALGAMMGVAAGGMAGMTGILMTVGLAGLAANFAGNMMALKRAKELKFPRSSYNAMEYARFAAAERAEAQDMCKKIQQNIQNAIAAYNQKFDKDLDTDDTSIFGDETAEFQDRGQTQNVSVDWDKDFTNPNAGQNESRIYEAFNSAEDANRQTQVLPAQHFVNQFAQMTEDQALQVIQELKESYKQAYGLWMQWTRYINVLVHIWGKQGITWEVVINSNRNSDTKSFIKNFVKEKLGLNGDDSDYQPQTNKQQPNVLSLRVSVVNYPLKIKVQQNQTTITKDANCLLLKDTKTKTYYAIDKDNFTNPLMFNKEQPFTLNFKNTMLTGQTIKDPNGKVIKILNKNAANVLKPVSNNGQTQTI